MMEKFIEDLIRLAIALVFVVVIGGGIVIMTCSSEENPMTEIEYLSGIRKTIATHSVQILKIEDNIGEMNKKLDKLLEHFKDTKIIHAEEVNFSHEP